MTINAVSQYSTFMALKTILILNNSENKDSIFLLNDFYIKSTIKAKYNLILISNTIIQCVINREIFKNASHTMSINI